MKRLAALFAALLALGLPGGSWAAQPNFKDVVCETTTTTGQTTPVELGGAYQENRTFADSFTTGTTKIPYNIKSGDGKVETGYGTFTDASPDTFSRDVERSTDGDGVLLSLSGTSVVCVGFVSDQFDGLWLAQSTAPSNPLPGDRWLDTDTGNKFVWYEDGDSGQWVQFDGGGASTVQPLRGHLWGLELANNGTDANNDIDVASGEAADSSGTVLLSLGSTLVKRIDASFAAGADQGCLDGSESVTGTPDTSTWYHFFAIGNGAGTNDVLCSESATAPTMPSGYNYFRRLGAVYNNGSGNLKAFNQSGDVFRTAQTDDRTSTSAISDTLLTLSVPNGIVVSPILGWRLSGNGSINIVISIGSADDGATTITLGQLYNSSGNDALTAFSNNVVFTNTSGQIYINQNNVGGSPGSSILSVYGWVDTRGRLN